MGKQIVVIGGGIIGLNCAYFLNKEGHSVTVLEASDMSSGASYVNAGYLTPSHIVPLAAPGVLWQSLKWMMDSSSPLYIKPRLDLDFLKWAWYFHRSSARSKVKKAAPVLRDINLLSTELYKDIKTSGDLGGFQLEHEGLLMLYQTKAAYQHELAVAEKASHLGLEVVELNLAELGQLQPQITIDAQGAIHYKCDAHTTPTEFMPKMIGYLKKREVAFRTNQAVDELFVGGDGITGLRTKAKTYTADEYVLAAGAWSAALVKKLGHGMPLQAGKGYSINVPRDTGITLPAILMEAKMAVTPMKGFTRFAGTMEFSGANSIVRKERVQALARGVRRFYPELEITVEEMELARTGLRPVSPDGLPYIGRFPDISNLVVATGHAMMGWSLGPATGKLVQQLVDGKKPEIDLTPFQPDRRFV
ncbi:MAG: FAD-dependent oxidoreductase [Bacteroidota bacterium]